MNISIEGKELDQSHVHPAVEIIGYGPDTILSKPIIKRAAGTITALSFDAGQQLAEKRCPFDVYVQVIDGIAELDILDEKFVLKTGEAIIIPAHARHGFYANVRFKMITTVIKGEYDKV